MSPRLHHHEPTDERRRAQHRAQSTGFSVLALMLLAALLLVASLASPSPAAAVPTAGGSGSSTTTIAPVSTSPTGPSTAPPSTGPASTGASGPLYLTGDALKKADTLSARAAALREEIDALDEELGGHSEAYNELAVSVERTNLGLLELRRELIQAQEERNRRANMLEERLRGVYKAGGRDQLLPLLFGANGFDDLYKRVLLIAQLAEQDQELVDNLRESTETLNAVMAEIDEQKREELSLRRKMERERRQIETKLAERKTMLAGLDSELQSFLDEERKRQEEEQAQAREALLARHGVGETYQGPVPQNGQALLDQLVQTAAYYMGIPYVWAGDRPSTGFDCSGFTKYVFAQHGIQLPHYSGYQARMGAPVNLPDIQVGDLLAFGHPVNHVGIYVGGGMFIHSPRTGDVIKVDPLSDRLARGNLAEIRRFPLQPRLGPPAVR